MKMYQKSSLSAAGFLRQKIRMYLAMEMALRKSRTWIKIAFRMMNKQKQENGDKGPAFNLTLVMLYEYYSLMLDRFCKMLLF